MLWRFLYFFCLFIFIKLIIPGEEDRTLLEQLPFTFFISFIMALVFAFGDNSNPKPGSEEMDEIGRRGTSYYLGLFLFSTVVVVILGGILFAFLMLLALPFMDEPFTWYLAGKVLLAMLVISLLMTLVQWFRDRMLTMGRRNEANL